MQAQKLTILPNSKEDHNHLVCLTWKLATRLSPSDVRTPIPRPTWFRRSPKKYNMDPKPIVTLIYLVCICMGPAAAQTMQDAQNLLETLTSGFNKNVRPAVNQSHPTYVNVSFDLVSLLEMDEIIGKLSVVGILYMSWFEPRMMWNPFLYGGKYVLNAPIDSVWKPDIVVAHPVESMVALGYHHKWVKVRYYYNGIANFSPGDVISTTCQIDVRYYPFDTQECKIMFIPYGMFGNEIYFITPENEVLLNFFTENGEWALDKTETATGLIADTFPFFAVVLKLRRRPTFVIVNVILPILFMGLLNVLVFYLPPNSGERVSYAITVLLAIAVFLTLVNDNLPKTSQPMSTICYFLLTNLVMSALIMMVTIYSLYIFHRPESRPVPRWLKQMVTSFHCPCWKRKKQTDVEQIKPPEETSDVVPEKPPLYKRRASPIVVKEPFTIQLTGSVASKKDPVAEPPTEKWATSRTDDVTENVTWSDVSAMFDQIAFIITLTWLVISAVTFFVMVARNTMP
ncbi:ACHA6-like protein [Mya arenaria]|uniref:ACHA6-like protein n=1 Tax=Mya arenaria TaxID=6604 RepID=A0ABY7DXG4_MYAAR|nr:ACHA6-like protein [Mya arenaria]